MNYCKDDIIDEDDPLVHCRYILPDGTLKPYAYPKNNEKEAKIPEGASIIFYRTIPGDPMHGVVAANTVLETIPNNEEKKDDETT